MKKLFIFSDTHKNTDLIRSLTPIMAECDYIIHLGDYVSDIYELKSRFKEKLFSVRGNGDIFTSAPDEMEIEIGGVKIFLSHGHKYGVKNTLENLGLEAISRECKVALYGHTHLAALNSYGGVTLINPGSFFSPRSGVFSYCYAIVWNGKIIPKIVEI